MEKAIVYETVTLTPNGAYSSGDAVGDVQELPTSEKTPSGAIFAIKVTDPAKQAAPLTIHVFNQEPSSTPADNAAFDLSAANAPYRIGSVDIAADDYDQFTSLYQAIKTISARIPFNVQSRKLWFQVQTTGTPTYAGSLSIQFIYLEL
jgi:hypothetical protein